MIPVKATFILWLSESFREKKDEALFLRSFTRAFLDEFIREIWLKCFWREVSVARISISPENKENCYQRTTDMSKKVKG